MENRLKDAEKIINEMEKETELSKVEELIKDNSIIFNYEDKQYRVRLLNLLEKEELDQLRRRKFGQLLKDKDILLEKDLIVQYKERGIDISEIDDQIKKISAEELDLREKLGESISKDETETILQNYKEQIENLIKKVQVLNAQKSLLLEYSLENSLLNYVSQVMTYLSIEEKTEDKWVKMFNNLDEFQKYPDEQLINKAATYSLLLQYF